MLRKQRQGEGQWVYPENAVNFIGDAQPTITTGDSGSTFTFSNKKAANYYSASSVVPK